MTNFCKSSGLPTPTALCMCPFCLRVQRVGQAMQGAQVVAKDPRDDEAAKVATRVLHAAARDPEIVNQAWNEALETKRKQA